MAAIYAIGILVWLAPHLGPSLEWDGDVVSRAVALGHSKGREITIFLVSCLLVPAACGVAVLIQRLQRRLAGSPGLLVETLVHVPLLCWPLPALIGRGGVGLGCAISGLLYMTLQLLLLRRGSRQGVVDLRTTPSGGHATSSTPTQPAHPRNRATAVMVLGGLGLAAVAPIGGGDDFSALKAATLATALVGVAVMVLGWWLAGASLAPRFGVEKADRVRYAMLLPFGGLVIANLQVSTGVVIAMVAAASLASGGLVAVASLRTTDGTRSWRRLASRLMHRSSRGFWWLWVPAVLYAAAYVHDVTGPVDLYHEGERITPAWEVSQGEVAYRDVYLWHGLFENGIKGQLGLALEESVAGVRRAEHLLEPLAVVSLYALLSIVLGSPLVGLIAAVIVVYTLPAPNARYWILYLACALVTLWALRQRRDPVLIAAGGALVSLALFYSLDGGLAASAAVAATLVYAHSMPAQPGGGGRRGLIRDIGACAGGALCGAALPLAYLVHHHALGAFVNASMDIAGGLSDRSSSPYPSPALLVARVGRGGVAELLVAKVICLYLPPLIIVWGFSHLVVRRLTGSAGGSTLTLPAVAFGAAAFFRAVIRRPDMDHVAKITPMVFVMLAILVHHHLSRMREGRRWSCLVPHGLMVLLLAGVGLRIMIMDPETAPARILKSRVASPYRGSDSSPMRELGVARAGPGVLANQETAAQLERLVSYITRTLGPDETFYDFTNAGLLYFLADRPCPTRFVQTTYAASRRSQAEVISALRETGPRLVLFPSGDREKYGYDWLIHPLRHPLIARYLYRNYVPSTRVGDMIILTPRVSTVEPPRPGVASFIASTPFVADLGHIPGLLGKLSVDDELIQGWRAREIAAAWRGARQGRPTPPASGIATVRIPLGARKVLSSPPLSLEPDGAHTLLLTFACDSGGEARVLFSSARHNIVDGSAAMTFTVNGDTMMHAYRLDVGLLPAWVWRGQVTGLQVEFPEDAVTVDIESVELRAYASDDAEVHRGHGRGMSSERARSVRVPSGCLARGTDAVLASPPREETA